MRYHTPHWCSYKQLSQTGLPAHTADWLFEKGSLTRRLREHCSDGFELELKSLRYGLPQQDEAQTMAMRRKRRVMIREVCLHCDRQPAIYARSVIPLKTLQGPSSKLAHLGNRPLADLLFTDRRTRRSVMQFARLDRRHRLYHGAHGTFGDGRVLWARRTIFTYAGQNLLVNEVFSPELGT